MQMPFRFTISIHRWYLGEMGGVEDLCMLGFNFPFDLIVSVAQAEVQAER